MTDQNQPGQPPSQPQPGQLPSQPQPWQPLSQPQQGFSQWAAPGVYPWTTQDSTPWSGPGMYPYVVPPPVRPRRLRTALIWSAVVLVISVGTGAAGYEIGLQHTRISSLGHGSRADISAPCPAGTTAPDPAATSPAGNALLARLLPITAGATRVTGGDQQGVLSLSDYISALYYNDKSEQQRLTARCFQAAAHREWTAPGGTTTSVWLIQFATADGARSYTLALEAASAGDAAYPDAFGVPGVADGKGFGNPKLDSVGDTLTRVMGDAGNVTMFIDVFVPARTDNQAAASVLQQQSALLRR